MAPELPAFIPAFIAEYLRRRGSPVARVAALWPGSESLLSALPGGAPVPGFGAPDPGGELDVAVGIPPWGWHPRLETITEASPPMAICDDAANVAIVRACLRLGPDGVGMFIVAPGFALRPGNRTALPVLARLGWRAEAVVGLPRGIFRPDSGSGRWLMAFSRRALMPVSGQLTGTPRSAEELLSEVVPVGGPPAARPLPASPDPRRRHGHTAAHT